MPLVQPSFVRLIVNISFESIEHPSYFEELCTIVNLLPQYRVAPDSHQLTLSWSSRPASQRSMQAEEFTTSAQIEGKGIRLKASLTLLLLSICVPGLHTDRVSLETNYFHVQNHILKE